MIEFILYPILFGIAYAIKGGQLGAILTNTDKVRSENRVIERLLDGKVLSSIMVLTICIFATVAHQANIGAGNTAAQSVLWFVIAWLLAVAPSMGEEYWSLLGRKDKGYGLWMPKTNKIKLPKLIGRFFVGWKFVSVSDKGYVIAWNEGNNYGMKKGVQRGVWMGAVMTLATGYAGFIWASFAFVPLAWLCLNYAPRKILDPWGWSEVLIGAVCFGIPFAIIVN